jgi:dolichol kinase
VHAATGLFALALAVLPHPWAIVCACLGIATGWIVFPLTGIERRLRRPGERYPGGLRTYPVAVLGLVLFLPPAEAAAAWAVLAFGDAAAAIVGRAVPSRSILGRGKATWSGSLAHLLVGGLTAWGMGAAVEALGRFAEIVPTGTAPGPAAAFLAAGAAVVLDALLPLPDDNLPCAAAAGGVLAAVRGLQ